MTDKLVAIHLKVSLNAMIQTIFILPKLFLTIKSPNINHFFFINSLLIKTHIIKLSSSKLIFANRFPNTNPFINHITKETQMLTNVFIALVKKYKKIKKIKE